MAKGILDIGAVYMFLKRLVQPFDQWDAYKEGVIDADGKVIIPKGKRTIKQDQSYGYFDRLVGNLKKLLAKVPGGRTRIATFAAALLLLREEKLDADDVDYLEERLNFYMDQAELLSEDVTNTAGSGNIAGIGVGPKGEPGIPPSVLKKHKKKNKASAKEVTRKVRAIMDAKKGN